MNYIQHFNLKPGDKVEVPKSNFNLVQHHVIVLGPNYVGQYLIAENVAGLFVRVVLADEFFKTNPKISRITPFEGSSIERQQAIERALEKMGAPYDLINFNCEHFANYVQSGTVKSDQVRSAFVVVGLLLLIALLSE